jgi:hypothetical protein
LAKDDVGVNGIAREVTQYILEGTRSGDREMVAQAQAVIPVLLETYRISAARATNDAISAAIGTVGDLAFGLLGQFISKLSPLGGAPAPAPASN